MNKNAQFTDSQIALATATFSDLFDVKVNRVGSIHLYSKKDDKHFRITKNGPWYQMRGYCVNFLGMAIPYVMFRSGRRFDTPEQQGRFPEYEALLTRACEYIAKHLDYFV